MLLSCDPIRTLSSFLREHTNTITTVFHIALSKDRTDTVSFPNRRCALDAESCRKGQQIKNDYKHENIDDRLARTSTQKQRSQKGTRQASKEKSTAVAIQRAGSETYCTKLERLKLLFEGSLARKSGFQISVEKPVKQAFACFASD